MPERYLVEFRLKVLDLIEAGRPVAEIAVQLGITAQTVYSWRNQDQIDRSVRAGVSTSESAELSAARKWILELETELEITRRANELLKAQTDPKGGVNRSVSCIRRGWVLGDSTRAVWETSHVGLWPWVPPC